MHETLSRSRFSISFKQSFDDELLDLGVGTDRDVAANLREMQRINDLLGGTHALTRHLFPRLTAANKPVTVLDLGTGGGGLIAGIVRWANNRGLDVGVLGLDWSRRNLAVARSNIAELEGITLLHGDACNTPLRPGAADYIISSLFLHHFPPTALISLLKHAYHLAGSGMIMSDLVRGWLPYLAFIGIQPVFARNALTRHDGLLSIRRAYTPGELIHLAREAGLPGARVHCHFPWRMTLVVDK